MNVADHSGSQWLTCFQDTGMEILGKSAEELGELRDQVRERARFLVTILQKHVNCSLFTCRTKLPMTGCSNKPTLRSTFSNSEPRWIPSM